MAKITHNYIREESMIYSKNKFEGKYRKYLNRLCGWIIKDMEKSTGIKFEDKMEIGIDLKIWQKETSVKQ